MSSKHNLPSIEVVGLYSFTAEHDRYLRFVHEKIASEDPANFDEETRAFFWKLGRERKLRPFTDAEQQKPEAELRYQMTNAVMIEALVSHVDANFDVGAFVQPDPTKAERYWQVAWSEKFLTADGEALLELPRRQKTPDEKSFRIVFVIFFWNPLLPLQSSYGELALPRIQPLPERLWRLTPYERPD